LAGLRLGLHLDQGGSKGDLAMVAGADTTMLIIMAEGKGRSNDKAGYNDL